LPDKLVIFGEAYRARRLAQHLAGQRERAERQQADERETGDPVCNAEQDPFHGASLGRLALRDG